MPRELERYPYFVEIVLESSSGKREARISDISSGGCYIDSIVGVHEGEDVAFEFKQPIDAQPRFTGTVAYVLDGFGFGVRFKDLTDEQKAAVAAIIKSHGG